MAGSAICRALTRAGYSRILTTPRYELDLLNLPAVENWFANHHPSVVVLAAAKVGGIHANNTYPAEFLLENLKIQSNVIETAWKMVFVVFCFWAVVVSIRNILISLFAKNLYLLVLSSLPTNGACGRKNC